MDMLKEVNNKLLVSESIGSSLGLDNNNRLSSFIEGHSRSLPADHPLPSLLRLPDIHVAADSPVAEPEGMGHGVTDVGPAYDRDGDTHDGVEYCHDFTNRGLWGNMTVS